MYKSLLFACWLVLGSIAIPADRPNVLFIAIDDLRPEMSTYGAKPLTPNIDKLAATGMRFDRAYCQQAVCGASRLSIMGGLYPTKTREQTFHVEGWRKRHPDLLTMNQHFGANGYETIGLGKIFHGSTGPGVDPKNWGQWMPLNAPGYVLDESKAALNAFKKLKPAERKGKEAPRGPTTEMADVPDDTYIDGKRALQAVEVLKGLAADENDEPFFFAVGLTKPHLPFVAPKKYWDLYQREDFAMPDNLAIPPGYPTYAANRTAGEMRRYTDYEGKMPTDFSDEMNKRLLHGYAACVSYMDANIGLVLDTLAETGLDKNTIVVFWGDHGWKLGDHSSWCKHTNFECDTRVPLIVRDPRLAGGKSTVREVELIDLYPTLCDLTGLETPGHVQGKSFEKLLANEEAEHREAAYSSYPAGKGEIGHSIRFGDYRYTEWRVVKDGSKTGKRVLTNLKADPGEVTNVVDKPESAEILKKAEALLDRRVNEAVAQ